MTYATSNPSKFQRRNVDFLRSSTGCLQLPVLPNHRQRRTHLYCLKKISFGVASFVLPRKMVFCWFGYTNQPKKKVDVAPVGPQKTVNFGALVAPYNQKKVIVAPAGPQK